MILVVILLIVFINFWCLFAQVFDRGHVCRNSVVLIAYIFDEIYLMPLILLNSALWDSVPDGSLQWSSSFLVSVCVCVSNLNRLTLGLLALKEVFSGFAASWGVSRHSARGGGFRTNACWAEHWAPVCLPTTFAKKTLEGATMQPHKYHMQIQRTDLFAGVAEHWKKIGKLVTVSFKLCMISSHWYVSNCAGADHVLGHCACRLCRRSCHYFALRISCPSLAYGGCACGLRLRFFAVHMHLSSRLSRHPFCWDSFQSRNLHSERSFAIRNCLHRQLWS